MSETIVIVGCGFPQLGLLRFCRAEGLRVVGVDGSEAAVGRRLCDEFVHSSTTDAAGIAEAVRRFRADGLTTCGSEHALLPTAEAAEAVGRPFYASCDLLRSVQHKDGMRAAFEAGGAPSPEHRLVRSLAEARAFVDELGLPVVVKPSRGWGQRGVRVVKSPAELEAAVGDALEAVRRVSDRATCLVERYVVGPEVSVDAWTVGGVTEALAVTERVITDYPDPPGITFAEAYPSGLSGADLAAAVDAAARGVAALGLDRGPTYTQLRVEGGRGYIIETALRLGGGLDPDVTFLASGVSLYRRILGTALAHEAWERSAPEGPRHGGAIGRFLIGRPGRVVAVEGLDAARAMPGVADAEVYVGVGDTVHPLTDGSKRVGHVLAFGADRVDAEARADAARALISIVTE